MLCCVGLIGGLAVGQSLGGPWTIVAPAAGFAIGLVADMKFMKGHHGRTAYPDAEVRGARDTDPVVVSPAAGATMQFDERPATMEQLKSGVRRAGHGVDGTDAGRRDQGKGGCCG